MKNLLMLILACICFDTVTAQSKVPSYGKIDKADLEMTDCDFDKGAVAVKLIDYCKMYYDRGVPDVTLFKTIYQYRVRIKILKDKGLSYANVEIPFYNSNNEESISGIDACVFNLDEKNKIKVTDVGKSSIYIKKINKRYSRVIIAFPEAKIGSVLEYRFKMERETCTDVKTWYFQDRIPTRYSEYDIKIPLMFNFTLNPTVIDSIDIKEKETEDMINVDKDPITFNMLKQNFIMRNLTGIRNEPFMGAPKDYQQRIEFLLSQIDHGNGNVENVRTTWNHVVDQLSKDEDFGIQLTKEIPGLDLLVKEALQITDKNERTNFLYKAIRTQMNYNDDESIFTEEGVIKAWQKKSGNAAEINLVLVKALSKAGIRSFPILLSTRDNGILNNSYYSLRQFNMVMAYVSTTNGFLVLDATDKVSNYRLTPESIVNTKGFIVEGENGRWTDIIDNAHKYQVSITLQGKIDEKGIMNGDCSVSSFDYSRKQRAEQYVKNADNFKQQYFIKPYPAVSVTDITIANVDNDSMPFLQKINFTMPLNNSGIYSYFNTNLFNDLETNPFIEDKRRADIDFGFQKQYSINGSFTIPDGYAYDALPQNVSISTLGRGLQYSRVMTTSGNKLSLKITVDFKRSFYLANGYADFHDFYKKLMNSLNEQVVIKKK